MHQLHISDEIICDSSTGQKEQIHVALLDINDIFDDVMIRNDNDQPQLSSSNFQYKQKKINEFLNQLKFDKSKDVNQLTTNETSHDTNEIQQIEKVFAEICDLNSGLESQLSELKSENNLLKRQSESYLKLIERFEDHGHNNSNQKMLKQLLDEFAHLSEQFIGIETAYESTIKDLERTNMQLQEKIAFQEQYLNLLKQSVYPVPRKTQFFFLPKHNKANSKSAEMSLHLSVSEQTENLNNDGPSDEISKQTSANPIYPASLTAKVSPFIIGQIKSPSEYNDDADEEITNLQSIISDLQDEKKKLLQEIAALNESTKDTEMIQQNFQEALKQLEIDNKRNLDEQGKKIQEQTAEIECMKKLNLPQQEIISNEKFLELNQQIKDLSDLIENFKKENSKLNEETLQLKEENTKLKEQNLKLNEQGSNSNFDNLKSKEENLTLKEENLKLKEENIALEKENSALKEENLKPKHVYLALKDENSKLCEEISSLKEEHSVSRDCNLKMKEENLTLKKDNLSLKKQLSILEKGKSDLNDEITKKIEEYDSSIGDLNHIIEKQKESLADEKKHSREKERNLEEQVFQAKIDLDELAEQLKEKDHIIERLKKSDSDSKKKITSLEDELQELRVECEGLQDNLTEKEQNIRKLETDCKKLEKSVHNQKEMLEKEKNDEIEALENQMLHEKSLEIQQLTTKLEEAKKAALKQLQNENQEKIRHLKVELENMHQDAFDKALEKAQGTLEKEKLKSQCEKNKLIAENDQIIQAKIALEEANSELKKQLHDILAMKKKLDDEKSEAIKALRSEIEKLDQLQNDFKDMYLKEHAMRKQIHNQLIEIQGNIRVFCRVRPILEIEQKLRNDTIAVEFPMPDQIIVHKDDANKMRFEFDKCFSSESTQEEVFSMVHPMITSCMDGYNVCIFAYGQTGSGKTHTVDGSLTNPGLNHRSLAEFFKIKAERTDIEYSISISMLEVYNETIRDLLEDSKKIREGTRLEVRQGVQGIYIPGMNEAHVETLEEAETVLRTGIRNRAVGGHDLNDKSSRSHSIFTVKIQGRHLVGGAIMRSKLRLIDLAGSERLSKIDVSGDVLKEAQNINRSLAALGDVINALGDKTKTHIPFRNSKLTYLLQDSLTGDSKVLMFVTCAPTSYNVGETLSSLNFASRCRTVELGAAKKFVESDEVVQLKHRIEELENNLKTQDLLDSGIDDIADDKDEVISLSSNSSFISLTPRYPSTASNEITKTPKKSSTTSQRTYTGATMSKEKNRKN